MQVKEAAGTPHHHGQLDILANAPWMVFAFGGYSMVSLWSNKVAVRYFGNMDGVSWDGFIAGLSGRLRDHMDVTLQSCR